MASPKMAGSCCSCCCCFSYYLLLFLLVLLTVSSASAQLADFGICEKVTPMASCEYTSQGCPPGKTLLRNVPMFAPWLCGGWQKICCVNESIYQVTTPTTTTTPPLIDDSNCGLGVPTGRIINGQNTSPCDWPYVVSIRGRNQPNVTLTQNSTAHACAGVIIDNDWVLTHAVCLYTSGKQLSDAPNEYLVVAGEYDTDRVDQDPRYSYSRPLEQFVPVARGFVHPEFAPLRYLTDLDLTDNQVINGNALALIKTAEPISNFCASVACLPSSSSLTSSSCDTFDQCVILGWGFETRDYRGTDGTLKQGAVKIYKDHVCDFLQTTVFASGPARFNSSACQSSDLNLETCLGDQGGPVLCYDGSRWSVQGILPFGLCQDPVNPYVIDVTPYQQWIYDTIRSNP
ncbi:chymotrypsinogen B-like [Babylonia areolata]|uniref:chymotrypsinogen B-like n=1 Tax=Babylonia areolata TaxID=304850 RepID=UPI003FD1A8C3